LFQIEMMEKHHKNRDNENNNSDDAREWEK
jgi:hypothetical protein